MQFLKNTACFVSRATNYQFSIEGFVYADKAWISTMRFAQHFTGWSKGLNASEYLTFHRDLLYATEFFGKLGNFVNVRTTAEGNKVYNLRLPGTANSGREIYKRTITLIQITGSFFELIQCTFKWVTGMPSSMTRLSNSIGNRQILGRKVSQISVLESVVRKPKDLCIFVSDFMSVALMVKDFVFGNDSPRFSFRPFGYGNRLTYAENACKFVSCTGKLILISTGQFYNSRGWFKCVDIITQYASEIKFIIVSEKNNRSIIDHGRYNR